MVSAWRNFKNIFSRPLFTIIFRPEMLKFHPYSILTGDTMVGFVIFGVLRKNSITYLYSGVWSRASSIFGEGNLLSLSDWGSGVNLPSIALPILIFGISSKNGSGFGIYSSSASGCS